MIFQINPELHKELQQLIKMDSKPKLSAILLSFNGTFQIVENTLNHLFNQTIVQGLELVLVTPSIEDIQANKKKLSAFHSYQIIKVDEISSVAFGYTVGVRSAKADLVVFCEDHCFPEPDWAALLVDAHQDDWAAVGPTIVNANPKNLCSWVSLFLDYSEWVDPVSSGVKAHIPGHNSCYKKRILLDYGDSLEQMLEAESLLHWDLKEKGYQVYLESRAKTRHLNFEKFISLIVLNFFASRRFAACRVYEGSWVKKWLYSLASPLIPFVRSWRIAREVRKPGRYEGNFFLLFSILFVVLLVCGVGEFLGYSLGIGNSVKKVTPFEFDRLRFLYSESLQKIRTDNTMKAAQEDRPIFTSSMKMNKL